MSLVLAQGFADLSFLLIYRFRRRSIGNLRLAFGSRFDDRALAAIARTSVRNFFRDFAEIGFALDAAPEAIRSEIPIHGSEHLKEALAKGEGVIVLSAHLGNFFLLGTRLAAEGYPVGVMVKPTFGNGRFADLMDSYRLRLGQKTIRARPRRKVARELIRLLRRNEAVILIADEYRSKGVPVEFFGRLVFARRGPVTLALRTGAAVVPMCMVRGPNGKLALIIEPEIELVQTGQLAQDISENTLRLTRWVERVVRAYPDQWNWTVIRWQQAKPAAALVNRGTKRRLA
jgi:KDO2-lipid IV(A) lauroyltransferase